METKPEICILSQFDILDVNPGRILLGVARKSELSKNCDRQ